MRIELFAMERMQSTYENLVDINLSESGVQPLRLGELAGAGDLDDVLRQELGYTQSNGTPALREAVAALYPGATPAHIEVTNGGSEANFVALWRLVGPRDEVVMMLPNYMQGWGLARGFGAVVRPWWLRQQTRDGRPAWRPDLDELQTLIGPRTRAIVICNPNNPTGARLSDEEVGAVCEAAARHGAWVLADEIYRGAEMDGHETPSAWGRYERVIVTSGLSKAYGLPGLRVGWMAGPPAFVEACWSYHDYTTIAPGALSDRLARVALAPDRRRRLLDRTRSILRTNYPTVQAWLAELGAAVRHIPPEAGAIAYVQYHHAINSTQLVTRLREAHSVLVVPGDHFQMDGYLRIGFGSDAAQLAAGLARVSEILEAASASAEAAAGRPAGDAVR